MLIVAIDSYHCTPLSVALIFVEGQKVSRQQNFFIQTLQVMRKKLNASWTFWYIFRVRYISVSETFTVLLIALKKNFKIGMPSYVYELVLFKLGVS